MGSDISFDIPGGRGVLPTRGGGPGRSLFKDYQKSDIMVPVIGILKYLSYFKVVQISDERPPVSKSSPHH